MSILSEASDPIAGNYIFAAILLLVALAVAVASGVFRSNSVVGPNRLPASIPAWPVLFLFFLAITAWFGSQLLYGIHKQSIWLHAGHTGHFSESDYTPYDFAFLSTFPGLLAILFVFVFLLSLPRSLRPSLGLNPSLIPTGLARGFLGILVAMPLVMAFSIFVEQLYQHFNFQHPAEHELLKVMKESQDQSIIAILVVGAILVAPVCEEIIFRGLFQTLLAHAFARKPDAISSASSRSFSRWLAIIITSIIFAAFHPSWSAPLIFILSLCLGYVYERTGNLWASITVHSLFNAFNTFQFLYFVHAS